MSSHGNTIPASQLVGATLTQAQLNEACGVRPTVKARVEANRKAFTVWWNCNVRLTVEHRLDWRYIKRAHSMLIIHRRRFPIRFGYRVINWDSVFSVDMTQPSIFNERGKLRVRPLRGVASYRSSKRKTDNTE